jgi:hypothetical protein
MANVDRLMQVDQFAVLPQSIEELAEVFLHFDLIEFAFRLISEGACGNVCLCGLREKAGVKRGSAPTCARSRHEAKFALPA